MTPLERIRQMVALRVHILRGEPLFNQGRMTLEKLLDDIDRDYPRTVEENERMNALLEATA